MLFRALSAAVFGIDANLVDVEVDLTPVRSETDNPSTVIIVGLPDLAVRESRERIRAAINNSAFFFPFHKRCRLPCMRASYKPNTYCCLMRMRKRRLWFPRSMYMP